MSSLKYIDKKKLEKILEMSGGYVLDFTNRTFQEFIFEHSNIDIYHDKYSYIGNSKGKRLRAFWEKESNYAVGHLISKILEYWKENKVLNHKEITKEEHALYNSCIEISNTLMGKEKAKEKKESVKSNESNFVDKQLELLTKYDDLFKATTAFDKRNRGYSLEKLIEEIFSLYQINVEKAFRRNEGAEQIDGAFKFEGWHYLVECKWTEKLTDIRQLDSLYGKVDRGGRQTMGLFLSINGWTSHVENLLKQNPSKSIILMDGMDLRYVLDSFRNVDLKLLLSKKISALNFSSEPFYSALSLEKETKK